MSTQIQRRRGTTAEHLTFTGAAGELTVDTDKNTVVVHDGITAGGNPLAASTHVHSGADITGPGVVAVTSGGTGASTADSALFNLGGASLLHTHSSLTAFGSELVFVNSSADFITAYDGKPKTIVLAADTGTSGSSVTYVMPSAFYYGINLVHFGDPSDVVLTGFMDFNVAASPGAAGPTTFRGITLSGGLNISTLFDRTLNLNNIIQASGTIVLNAASGIVEITNGKIDSYDVANGTLKTLNTTLLGGSSTSTSFQDGGLVIHNNLTAEVNVAGAVISASNGTMYIDGIRIKNPGGFGLELKGDNVSYIDGFIVTGSILTNGLPVAGSATLYLGTHNINNASADLVTASSGTIIPLDHPIADNTVTTSTIATGAIVGSHIQASTITRSKVEGELKQVPHQTFIPIIGSVAGLAVPGGSTVNQIIFHHNVTYSGFLRQLIIEPTASATPASSITNLSLIRHNKRLVGGSTFADGDFIVVASGITVSSGQTVLDVSTLGQFASSLTLGGSPLVGLSVSAASDPTASTGMGLSLLACNFAGGSSMENLMITYILQIDRTG